MPTFNKKEWKNRVSEYPVRRRLTMIQDEGNQFVADVSREEGTVTQAGDAFSAGNMNDLENRIEEAFENTGGGNFVGVLYHASLVDFPDVPCWEDMSAQEKAKYDASTGATVNFLDEDLPSNIIGNTDISYIGDGTLTGGLAAHEDDIDELNSALNKNVVYNWSMVDSAVSTTAATVSTIQSRKFSKVETLCMFVLSGNIFRTGLTLPRSAFDDGNIVSLSWVNSANVQKWVEIQYISDTSVKIQKSSNETDTTFVKIYALGSSESPF